MLVVNKLRGIVELLSPFCLRAQLTGRIFEKCNSLVVLTFILSDQTMHKAMDFCSTPFVNQESLNVKVAFD